jgi:hypothetical protein
MQTEDVSYRVGSGVAFVTPGRILLVGGSVSEAASDRLWDSVQTGRAFHDLVDAVVTVGLRNIDSFGVVYVEGKITHVLVRGLVTTVVHAAERREDFTAMGTMTWVERSFEDPDAVDLSFGPEDQSTIYPFGSGVVHAGWVRLGTPVGAHATRSVQLDASQMASDRAPSPQTSASAGLAKTSEPADWTFPAESDDVGEQTLHPLEPHSHEADEALDLPPTIARAGTTSSEDEAGDEFDALFGSTQFRAVEEAAIRTDEANPEVAADHSARPTSAIPPSVAPDEPLFFSEAPPPRLTNPPLQPPPPASGSLIEGVPGVATPPPSFQTEERAIQHASDLDSPDDGPDLFTISRAQLLKMKETTTPTHQSPPVVHGILCSQGHPNPPQATSCRVCHGQFSESDPITMPRPLLGILKFSDGTEALLDRPLIIGRSPRAERVSSKEIPQLVSLSSPDQNISRNHLEIRIDGWHVIVVDLESVNGTVVTNPGQAPELLRAGEEVPIVPGAVVSIADEITFIYEVAQ